ncbi:MAG: AMP-binding protein, partial [Cyanophyceae cyanobacterium]
MHSNLLVLKSPLQNGGDQVTSFVELLQYRAQHQGNQDALMFLGDGENQTNTLTYQELDRQSRAIAAQLQQLESPGGRALLVYPPGLEFVVAFFGCLYAGVVAVPAYPPRRDHFERLDEILDNSGARVALTTDALFKSMNRSSNTAIQELEWLATDNLAAPGAVEWQPPTIDPESLAFLQYTSGSTGKPKGVMVSHRN